jgi:hypothetical protein
VYYTLPVCELYNLQERVAYILYCKYFHLKLCLKLFVQGKAYQKRIWIKDESFLCMYECRKECTVHIHEWTIQMNISSNGMMEYVRVCEPCGCRSAFENIWIFVYNLNFNFYNKWTAGCTKNCTCPNGSFKKKVASFICIFISSCLRVITEETHTGPPSLLHQKKHLKGVWHEIFDFRFFSWIGFPGPWVYYGDHIEFLWKFAEIFESKG